MPQQPELEQPGPPEVPAGKALAGKAPVETAPVETAPPRPEPGLADPPLLGAVALGGALGALARYGLQEAFPHGPGEFGWATLAINVSGCLAIGVIAVLIAATPGVSRLVRPFAVTGILGGYTTFSTYIVDIQRAVLAGAPRTALLYAAATLACALAAAWAGILAGDAIAARRGPRAPGPTGAELTEAELAESEEAS
ncbi:MAG TPA: CrcB family protein [Trebonia sp.]|jgi:CrcB protein|nr:CrcB family protein [Trebonia sp.]